MNYCEIKWNDIANGPGVRTSLFVSGCRHKCPNCFNEVAWDFNYGKGFDESIKSIVVNSLDSKYIAGLTILGGEPMEPENQKGVLDLIRAIREKYGKTKSIWIYTGCIYEKDFVNKSKEYYTEYTDEILDSIDILVDGPFIQDLYDISLKFRGSSNQRILEMKLLRRK